MIALRTEREIALLRAANEIVAEVLVTLAKMVEPGMTTGEMDVVAHDLIVKMGGRPAFLGYKKYPKSTCISVEDEVVHGIPGKRKLKTGQVVSIDVGVVYKGYVGDAAITVPCDKVDQERKKLLETTDRALAKGISEARAGAYLRDVSRAIQTTCEDEGLSIVRAFVGHGIGTKMHEDPQVPNFVTGGKGHLLREGMVLALEPMVNVGVSDVKVLSDGWTAVTADGKPSAHFEHSIVIRDGEPLVLSATPKLIWGRS